MKKNPFAQQFATMQQSEGHGSSITVRGFQLEADEDGIFEIPVEMVNEVTPLGLVPAVRPIKAVKR